MTAQTLAVIDGWRDNQVVDVLAEMMAITSRTLATTMFSDTMPGEAVRQAVNDIATLAAGTYRRMLMPPPLDRLPTPGNLRYHRAMSRLHHTMSGVIADRRASGVDHGDLISAMLGPHDSDLDDGLSDSEAVDNLMTFVLAGAESTSSTLAWAMYLLGTHADVEQRLHAEVDTVLNGTTATFDHLSKLDLTSRVVTEALRLYPPGWMFTRTVTASTRLGRHHLPAGTDLLYSPYLIHHRSDLHPLPERFNPDRWDSTRHPQPHRDAFVPFGTGARKCIGDQFSLTEATLTLATIASRWHLKPLPGLQVRPSLAIALRPRDLRMRAALRHEPAARTSTPGADTTPAGI
jgi:pentalenene oxygenase